MLDRKLSGNESETRRRNGRHGAGYDPIENDLGVAFVIVISIALFMMAQDSVTSVWTGIGGCLDQMLRVAGS
jgi:hypothetical protein